jgi:hypothetical protein
MREREALSKQRRVGGGGDCRAEERIDNGAPRRIGRHHLCPHQRLWEQAPTLTVALALAPRAVALPTFLSGPSFVCLAKDKTSALPPYPSP